MSLWLSRIRFQILAADGTELKRLQSVPGDDIPLDAPAGVAFDSRRKSLLIVNHALLSGIPGHFAVVKAEVDDAGDPLEKPAVPEIARSGRSVDRLATILTIVKPDTLIRWRLRRGPAGCGSLSAPVGRSRRYEFS
jgi:hypothetical protein